MSDIAGKILKLMLWKAYSTALANLADPSPTYEEIENPSAPKPSDGRADFDNEDSVNPADEHDDYSENEAQAVARAATRAKQFNALRLQLLQSLALHLVISGREHKDSIISRLAPVVTDETISKGTFSDLQTRFILLQLELLKGKGKATLDTERKLGELIASAIFIRLRNGSTDQVTQYREKARHAAQEVEHLGVQANRRLLETSALLQDQATTVAQYWLLAQLKHGLDIVEDNHPDTAPPPFS